MKPTRECRQGHCDKHHYRSYHRSQNRSPSQRRQFIYRILGYQLHEDPGSLVKCSICRWHCFRRRTLRWGFPHSTHIPCWNIFGLSIKYALDSGSLLYTKVRANVVIMSILPWLWNGHIKLVASSAYKRPSTASTHWRYYSDPYEKW